MKSTIGIALWSLQQLTMVRHMNLEQILNVVAELGVTRVDMMDEYLPVWPHSNLQDLYNLRKLLDRLGLKLKTCWMAEYIVGELLTSTMEKTLQHFQNNASVISLLGGEYIVLPFDLNMPTVNHEQACDMFQRFCEKAIPICEETGIKIAINPSRQYNPPLALRLCRAVSSPQITIAPDSEAWRRKTDDIPLVHAELPGAPEPEPLPVSMFAECLPYSPIVHFKLMGFDEHGEDPHFPVPELMDAINNSPIDHHLVIEYEGWIPDVNPHLDPIERTRMAVALLKKYQK